MKYFEGKYISISRQNELKNLIFRLLPWSQVPVLFTFHVKIK